MLQEIAAMSFDPSNLWMLHQYYYSPNSPDESSACTLDMSADKNMAAGDFMHAVEAKIESSTTSCEVEHSCGARPAKKKRGNHLTMTRIAEYPRIQVRAIVIDLLLHLHFMCCLFCILISPCC
jgi:hypothetical protein